MTQAYLCPTSYQGLGSFGESMPPKEPLQYWKNRTIYLTTDITQARKVAAAMLPDLVPILDQAQVKVNEAKALIKLEESIPQWTRFREERIDAALFEARELYNSVRQMASLRGQQLEAMTTWTQSPSLSKGASAVPGVTTDPDSPTVPSPGGPTDETTGIDPGSGATPPAALGGATPWVLGGGLLLGLWLLGSRGGRR